MYTAYVILGIVAFVVIYDVVVFTIQRTHPNNKFYTISQTFYKAFQRDPWVAFAFVALVGLLTGHLFYFHDQSTGGIILLWMMIFGFCLFLGNRLFPQ